MESWAAFTSLTATAYAAAADSASFVAIASSLFAASYLALAALATAVNCFKVKDDFVSVIIFFFKLIYFVSL